MDWKDLTDGPWGPQQKLCRIELPPDTTLNYIVELVKSLPNPFKQSLKGPHKRSECRFSWHIENNFTLVIHASLYLYQE